MLNNRLQGLAEETQFTLEHSAHSPSIREAADCSCALFTRYGEMISQATAIPVHLGSLEPAVRGLLNAFPANQMQDGDIYIMNDPYSGGQHFPDIIMLVPLFVSGELVGMHCSLGHHQDIGGLAPGGNPPNATDTFQEGLCLPPVKLYDRGVENTAIQAILRANVRIPDTVWGDVESQIASSHVAKEGIRRVCSEFGLHVVQRGSEMLIASSEQMSRAAVLEVPDGSYFFQDFLDNDGIELDRRIRICARVTVRGSDVSVDFTGTDRQCKGPFNAVPSVALSAVRYVIRCVTGPDIPNNSGCFRMLTLTIPDGTVLNPRPPAPVSCRAVTLRRVVDCIMGAFAQALPDIVPAASNGHPLSQRLGGQRPETGALWVTSIIGTGGMGARPSKDGVDAIQTDASNSQNIPVEYLESYFPVRVLEYALWDDSGGAGRTRGGLGLAFRYRLLEDETTLTHRGERFFTQPWGLAGGLAGRSSTASIVRADGGVEVIPSKGMYGLNTGDEVRVYTAGGGGHGSPLDRDPELVAQDVRQRKVSVAAAREMYGVTLKASSLAVDEIKTARLRRRASERASHQARL